MGECRITGATAKPCATLDWGKCMLRCLINMSTKEILLEVAEKLPPDATLVDAIYELEFRQAVEDGLAELDRGEGIPIEQIKAKINQWAGK